MQKQNYKRKVIAVSPAAHLCVKSAPAWTSLSRTTHAMEDSIEFALNCALRVIWHDLWCSSTYKDARERHAICTWGPNSTAASKSLSARLHTHMPRSKRTFADNIKNMS